MRCLPLAQIDACVYGLVHEYMHQPGGLRRPGRGLL